MTEYFILNVGTLGAVNNEHAAKLRKGTAGITPRGVDREGRTVQFQSKHTECAEHILTRCGIVHGQRRRKGQ